MPRPSSVPRDRVVAYARTMTECPLPDAELDRMAGTPIASMSTAHPRDNAKCSVLAARTLLGEVRVDEHHPLLGLHRTWLTGVHDEGPVARYAALTTLAAVDRYHRNLTHYYGSLELAHALRD